MLWVIEESLLGRPAERKARLNFIKEISGDKRVSWQELSWCILPVKYYYCVTDDGVNGVVITAHMYMEVILFLLLMLNPATKDFFVLNICKMSEEVDRLILSCLMEENPKIGLYFAKQDINPKSGRYMNHISDVGDFGFLTSKSERIMFFNRKKGVVESIAKGFDKVLFETDEKGEF